MSLPAFPPGAVLPARNIQEISPDLENEFAWQESLGVQRQLGSRTSASVDFNVNRSHKHGFLDTNYPTPISKDVINAAGGQIVRTTAQADAHAADRAGAQRIPPHRGAHQRRTDLV